MRGELPKFKRCCFCIPLRRGILGWGYLQLVLNLLTLCLFTFVCIRSSHRISVTEIPMLVPSIILVIGAVIFSVLLIVACHKKSPRLLKIYLIYGIVEFIILMAFTSIFTYFEIKEAISTWTEVSEKDSGSVVITMLSELAVYFTNIFIFIYVLLLVRSERLKLENQNLEIQFVNNAAEGEARCVCADNHDTSVNTDNGHYPSVQYTNDRRDTSVQYTNDGHDTSVQNVGKGGAVV